MKRYIEVNALMEYCSNQKSKTISNNDIARFPTADVVEVVYCKDCKYYESDGGAMMVCDVFDWYANDGDDYCSHGERRE